jgi:hypothetical protein
MSRLRSLIDADSGSVKGAFDMIERFADEEISLVFSFPFVLAFTV